MRIETEVIAKFIVWLMRVYKIPTGNSLQWWFDNCNASVAGEINQKVIQEINSQTKKP